MTKIELLFLLGQFHLKKKKRLYILPILNDIAIVHKKHPFNYVEHKKHVIFTGMKLVDSSFQWP